MFFDVRNSGVAAGLGEEGEMKREAELSEMAVAIGKRLSAGFFAVLAAGSFLTLRAGGAETIVLAPEAQKAMETMYAGDPDAAIEILHELERAQPENPQGYLLEAEARWWKFYCAALDVKWGMVDAQKRGKKAEDQAYFALTDTAVRLAQVGMVRSDTAEMHVYAGMGWALRARLLALRGENRAVAHAGVAARSEFLKALQLNPQAADATAGMGLYNYYIDTLSGIVKMLRFFMGIPGGNKQEGIRQLEIGMKDGVLMAVEARFYLAKNLRTYDEKYERAVEILEPLVQKYPRNPIFQLLLGNFELELGRNEKAAEYFRAALNAPADAACAARVKEIANSFAAAQP
jgi:tetratricopeptide (TPR) repeat protein